jgi:S-adenosylmethionine decarboxylase
MTETPTQFIGSHLIFDCSRCRADIFNGVAPIREIIYQLADAIGTKILSEGHHIFPLTAESDLSGLSHFPHMVQTAVKTGPNICKPAPAGVTYFAIVSASHIVAHTWPEYAYLGVDIFSCREINEANVIETLKKETGTDGIRCRKLERSVNV